MVIERELQTFWEFLPGGLLIWALTFGAVLAITLGMSFVFALVNHGPSKGPSVFFSRLQATVVDLFGLSPRRIWAMANLAFVEAIRRRVWVVLVLYVLILLFAGWFLRPDVEDPARLYIDFVMFASTLLVLGLGVVLSAFSLPTDIANRTIFTVVTKPVRSTEILLGRVLGFGAICTLLLVVMGAIGLLFVHRSLVHTHPISGVMTPGKLRDARGADIDVLRGKTEMFNKHEHEVTINVDAKAGETSRVHGHSHSVTMETVDGQVVYKVGPPRGYLTARVPVYARELKFRDSEGEISDKGISVGAEWEYRSYIEGATRSAAIYQFRGLRREDFPRDRFPDGLQFDITLSVFRSHKGDIEKGVAASMILSNPHTGYRAEPKNFVTREFNVLSLNVPYTLRARQGPAGRPEDADLWANLIAEGDLTVEIVCLDSQQYVGVAKPDLYILAAERPFYLNFAKGYGAIWLQMVVVTSFGVFFSTFLNGFVSLFSTMAAAVGGLITGFMYDVATGIAPGGSAMESFFRMINKDPISTPLAPGAVASTVRTVDFLLFNPVMLLFAQVLPDLNSMGLGDWVSSGYDIRLHDLAIQAARAMGFFMALIVLGHYVFKGRELAK